MQTLHYFKKRFNIFFASENMKKTPSKVAHNQPRIFFFSTGLAAQTAPKQKSCTTESPLMQDWVFRQGGSVLVVSVLKCAKVRSHIAHPKKGRTHAPRTYISKGFSDFPMWCRDLKVEIIIFCWNLPNVAIFLLPMSRLLKVYKGPCP